MRRAIAIGCTVLLVGCTRAGASGAATEMPIVTPSAGVTAGPASPATNEPPHVDAQLQHTIDLRRSLGLRSDLAWIEAVAADPRATTTLLFIPLLPEEEAEVVAADASDHAVAAVVNEYANLHLDEFAGMYIDRESNAGVVSLWTGHLAEHEAAIRARLAPGARASFLQVEYSEAYLRSVQDRVVADIDWMRSIPAVMQSAYVDTIRDVTVLSVSSANPRAVELIQSHFGLGAAFEATSDGTGAALIPWGTVEGRVRTRAGDVPGPAEYNLRWHGTGPGDCGGGDVGYGVSDLGTFTLPCQQGTWMIEVTVPDGNDWRSIGEGTVAVTADHTSKLDIVLTEAP
ncbi:MAG: hypothetical protein ACXW4H_04225 [Candidatus Limnocylindrales bacterium]